MQRLKRIIGDLSTTQGKLKLIILLSAVLLIIGATSTVALKATSTPQFCSSCHEMTPEYVTWKVSSHQEVSCVDCHIEPGVGNFIKHKIGSIKQVYGHVTQTYPSPITMPHDIESYVCEQCHDVAEIQPETELVIPHEQHSEAEVECVDCHSGVAHANIVSRELTIDGDWDSWTLERAESELIPANTLPSMDSCMSCHEERQVDNSCATCHTEKGMPEDHQLSEWPSDHGVIAKESNAQDCAECHGVVEKAETLVDYSRQSEFCSSCHQQKPNNHDNPQWMLNHKETVLTAGMNNCFTCHDKNKDEDNFSPSSTYCNSCHSF